MSFLGSLFNSNQPKAAQTALLATAVVALGYAAYSLFGSGTKTDLAPAVTEDEARTMMKKILEQVKLNAPRFLRAADSIKQQIAAQGQEIEDAQIFKAFILPHLETAIRDVTQSVLDEFDVDEDELEEAVDAYVAAGDEELIHISKQLKAIYKQFGGETGDSEGAESTAVSAKAAEMSLDEVVALLEELAQVMIDQSDSYCSEFVGQFGTPRSQQDFMKFQQGLMQITEA